MSSQVLLRAVDRVKLDGWVTKHLELCIEISTTFMHSIQEKSNRPMGVANVFPWGSIPTPRGRVCILLGGQLLAVNGTLLGTVKVGQVDLGDGGMLPRMFNQESPQQREAPLEQRIGDTVILTFFSKDES